MRLATENKKLYVDDNPADIDAVNTVILMVNKGEQTVLKMFIDGNIKAYFAEKPDIKYDPELGFLTVVYKLNEKAGA